MSSSICDLKPTLLWSYFDQICRIPHGSKNEFEIMRYLAEEGKKLGAEVREDSTGNVCLAIPATSGYENAPTVILQGHVDMVCEKRAGFTFDFEKESIRPVIDGEWVRADNTTLGSDNGIGVAAAMAVAADKQLQHGPLELLFTVDEETGLTGAMGLDPKLISGKILINMDSEEDGMLYVGCAGGQHLETRLPLIVEPTPAGYVGLRIEVSGLLGGHSGCDIHLNRANAVKLLARSLRALLIPAVEGGFENEIRVVSINAGTAHNAIPRDGETVIAVASERVDWAIQAVENLNEAFRREFALDEELLVKVTRADVSNRVFTPEVARRIGGMLLGFHNGVFAMSRDIDGLVETSNSLAVARTSDDEFYALNSSRSSSVEGLIQILDQNEGVALLAGAHSERLDGYPGWQPNMDSKILQLMIQKFKEKYEKEPIITAIHAGLECGLIGEHFKEMDMVSFGPEIRNPHSPDEKVWIPSVERFYDLLQDTLKAIAEGDYR